MTTTTMHKTFDGTTALCGLDLTGTTVSYGAALCTLCSMVSERIVLERYGIEVPAQLATDIETLRKLRREERYAEAERTFRAADTDTAQGCRTAVRALDTMREVEAEAGNAMRVRNITEQIDRYISRAEALTARG
jgi:hypothetical protein